MSPLKKYSIHRTLLVLLLGCIYASTTQAWAESTCATTCHIIKPYEKGLEDATLLVFAHADAGLTCIDCHEQTKETRDYEKQAYKNGEYDDPIAIREYESEFCFRCHEGYETLAKLTVEYEEKWHRNPHKSHLDEPDCYECHRVHRPSIFVCAECHPANWMERLPSGWTIQ